MGLQALLGEAARPAPSPAQRRAQPSRGGVREMDIARIKPNPAQPRVQFDEDALDELANSIRERGVLQPILLRPNGEDFLIVAGERRWRAAQRARLHSIPAIVREIDEFDDRRDRPDREYPAPGPQPARGSGGLSPADPAPRPYAGRCRPDRPQVAQPHRQPVEIARSSRVRASIAIARRYQHGPCAGRCHRRRSRGADPRNHRARGCRCARRRSGRGERRARPGPAPTSGARARATPPRPSMPTSTRSSGSSATSSASRSRSPTRGRAGPSTLHYSSLDQLDMVCQRLSRRADLATGSRALRAIASSSSPSASRSGAGGEHQRSLELASALGNRGQILRAPLREHPLHLGFFLPEQGPARLTP